MHPWATGIENLFGLRFRVLHWSFFVRKATFSCQLGELDRHTGKGWGDVSLHQPSWVTTVKPRSSPNLARIVSQGLLLGNPRKSTGKINTVSLFKKKKSSRCIINAPEETFQLKVFICLKEMRCEMPKYRKWKTTFIVTQVVENYCCSEAGCESG